MTSKDQPANFVDLTSLTLSLTSHTVKERSQELANLLPQRVVIYALGGFPFIQENQSLFWNGKLANQENLRQAIKQALGASASLTYVNKSNKTLDQLGQICLDKRHFWALNWINLGLVFANFPLRVELAFAHDTRFHMGWVVSENPTGEVFTAIASLKHWVKFVSHREDLSFDPDTRRAMSLAYELIKDLL